MIAGSQRSLFDLPQGVTYLNCAYMAPSLRAVTAAGIDGVRRKGAPWTVQPADFFTDAERLRVLVGRLLGADADGVALVPAVSYGIGVAARNARLGPGDSIVVIEDQFPSNVYPWRDAAARTGATIVTAARPDDLDWTGAVVAAIDDTTAVVALPQCHWTDGSAIDLVAVGEAARRAGARLVVDASQSLGASRLDMAAVQPDYLVAVAYKWLLGPYGLAYLWVAPQHRSGTPLEFGWLPRVGAEDFAGLVDYQDEFQPGARRFDVGERSNFATIPMAIAAMTQLLDWGVDAIAGYIGELNDRAEALAAEAGLEPVGRSHRLAHLMGFRYPGGRPPDLVDRLAAERVHVSVRGDSVRVAPHVYNSSEDIDRLFAVVAG